MAATASFVGVRPTLSLSSSRTASRSARVAASGRSLAVNPISASATTPKPLSAPIFVAPKKRTVARDVSSSAGNSVPVVAAASADENAGNSFLLKTGSYVILWYAFNIVFNILNKQSLNAFPCPYFMSAMQLVVSGLWMAMLWITKIQKPPKVDGPLIMALLPVALAHTVGHVTACVSFSLMAVSFAHIVKSSEPVFSVILSGVFLGTWAPVYVWASLLPIVAGCSLSAMKELSFAWPGFLFAMASNLGMVMRNIFSKKTMTDFNKEYNLDGINTFGLLSIISCFYCIPLAFVMERQMWSGAWDTAVTAMGQTEFLKLLALSGIFYHLYNQLSYMVLGQGLTATSFSVSNTMKRVAVVVSSVLFFKNPVTFLNWLGSFVAIIGTLLYSLACQKEKSDKKAAAAKSA